MDYFIIGIIAYLWLFFGGIVLVYLLVKGHAVDNIAEMPVLIIYVKAMIFWPFWVVLILLGRKGKQK